MKQNPFHTISFIHFVISSFVDGKCFKDEYPTGSRDHDLIMVSCLGIFLGRALWADTLFLNILAVIKDYESAFDAVTLIK